MVNIDPKIYGLEQIEIDDKTLLTIHNQIDKENKPESLQIIDLARIMGGTRKGETIVKITYGNYDLCHISRKGLYECDIILDNSMKFSRILYSKRFQK